MAEQRISEMVEAEKLEALQRKLHSRIERKKNIGAEKARLTRYREKHSEKLKGLSAERSRRFREKEKSLSFEEKRKRVLLNQIKKWATLDKRPAKEAAKPLPADEFLAVYGYGKAVHNKRRYLKQVNDPVKNEMHNVRTVVTNTIGPKPAYSDKKIIQVVGCNKAEFIAHIERSFEPGMSWAHRGEWIL